MAWYNTLGKDSDTVISTRVRLARNINGYPFASRLDVAKANEIIEKVSVPLEASGFRKINFSDLSPVMATSYVERHYVSPEFATKEAPHALFLQETAGLAVMVCEEDHLRIQSILPGLALEDAYLNASRTEKRLDEDFDFAYSDSLGYLTHCPTNLGTGMRASVMMFLPAMTMSRQIQSLSAQLQKLGLTVRGMYGEGSSAEGCIYQISNQITLGITEEETLDKLSKIIDQIVVSERQLRESVGKNDELCDRIARAEGIFRYAKMISSSEFMKLYADLRLGISTDITQGISFEKLDSLLVRVMPANLMLESEQLSADEKQRDKLRAEKIRSIIG